MITDETLYRCFLCGDENGLRMLIERYGNNLTLYINGIIHDVHDAEDLMIEAFSRIVSRRPHFEGSGFKAYLYKTARNLALRYAMKHKHKPIFGFDDMDEPESQQLLEQVLGMEERNRTLHRCIAQLKPDYREALFLVFFENLSHKQAGKIIGKSEKQLYNLVQRGKQSLKIVLEQEGITSAQYI